MGTPQRTGASVIERLSAYVAGESFDGLPDATVRAARRAILDTLGVMLAGSVEATAVRARAAIAHRRAGDEATIVGTSLRASVEDAALANGTRRTRSTTTTCSLALGSPLRAGPAGGAGGGRARARVGRGAAHGLRGRRGGRGEARPRD